MNNSSNNGSPDDSEEHGELVWNEFDWERYLRQRDEAVGEYRQVYDKVADQPERIDEIARQLGWEPTLDGDADGDDDDDEDFDDDLDPYTLHRNPVYVATRALFAGLIEATEAAALSGIDFSAVHAFPLLRTLHAAEMSVVLGVQSLDLGDTALGISQLKRALSLLNRAMSLVPDSPSGAEDDLPELNRYARPRLFDLREICLRVVRESRLELDQPLEDEEN